MKLLLIIIGKKAPLISPHKANPDLKLKSMSLMEYKDCWLILASFDILSTFFLVCRTADSKKAAATISPLCSPTCKVVVSTSPKLTTSTQPIYSTSNIKAADVSLFSTRPVHPVPLKTPMEPSTSPGQEMMLRKHSKPSLSQPTIPEEGPEHSDDLEPQSQGVSTTPIPVSILRPKPELKVVKNLSQESSGAISKNSPTCSLTKSSHCLVVPKSPKSLKQESVEKLLKAIRGTNRLDTKSQKRENSISPSSHASLPETNITSSPSKSFRRDGMRKNGQDKKDIFKNPHWIIINFHHFPT